MFPCPLKSHCPLVILPKIIRYVVTKLFRAHRFQIKKTQNIKIIFLPRQIGLLTSCIFTFSRCHDRKIIHEKYQAL